MINTVGYYLIFFIFLLKFDFVLNRKSSKLRKLLQCAVVGCTRVFAVAVEEKKT